MNADSRQTGFSATKIVTDNATYQGRSGHHRRNADLPGVIQSNGFSGVKMRDAFTTTVYVFSATARCLPYRPYKRLVSWGQAILLVQC